MLTVEDESFWEGLQPVQFGTLPRLQDSVTVIGWVLPAGMLYSCRGMMSKAYAVMGD